jgi:hypothetical protein
MLFSNLKVRKEGWTDGRTDSSDFPCMPSFHPGHANNAYKSIE